MKILLAPLDWGLGHATRSLTLAHALESLGHQVCLASCGGSLHLLREALPGRSWWEIPDYRIRYATHSHGFLWAMLKQIPQLIHAVRAEQAWLQSMAKREGFEAIISDGRYGLWHDDVPCFLVTHQIHLMPPMGIPFRKGVASLLEFFHYRWLRRFTEIWIPDVAEAPGLSGQLGHTPRLPSHARYVGPLNRFAWETPISLESNEISPDILAVVSGPEPQRSLFEAALLKQMKNLPGTRVLIQGLPAQRRGDTEALELQSGKLHVLPHLPGIELRRMLLRTRALITRSGYTSVMELACLGVKPILFVPTPGQPEQEYLAAHLGASGWVRSQSQDHLDLRHDLAGLDQVPGLAGALNVSNAPGATREGLQLWLNHHVTFSAKVKPA
jgi:UDP:flavonoid glycosyltransferase YjiC (YdhE family)